MAQPENRFAQQHAETPPAILDIDKPTTATKRFREFNEVRYFGFQTFLGGFLLNVLSIPVLQYLHCAPSPDFHALVCLICIMGIAVTFVSIAFNRPAFLCPHCGKHVNTHIDWQCGYCDATNTDVFPGFKHKLLGGCGSCHRVALSMVCYHCATPVCLSDAQKDRHPARPIGQNTSTSNSFPALDAIQCVVARVASPDQEREQIESLKREKQRIDQQTEIMNASIALAMAEGRYTEVKGARENRFKDVIHRMLQPLEDKHHRRAALLMFGEKTSSEIDARPDLTPEQKAQLKEELEIDLEQARLENA